MGFEAALKSKLLLRSGGNATQLVAETRNLLSLQNVAAVPVGRLANGTEQLMESLTAGAERRRPARWT